MSPGDLAALGLAVLAAYLLGAVPFGLLVGRAVRGVDLRAHGSGNLGATNALRVLGKGLGGLVLALDAAKGLLPVLLLPLALGALGRPAPGWLPVALAAAAVLGHVFPVYLRFRGGKGVATSAGAFCALHPLAFAVALATWLLTVLATRIVSLGSILAALALPAAALAFDGPAAAFGPDLLPRTVVLLLAAALVVVRHRANLRRLLAGAEPRLGQKATPPLDPAPVETDA